MPPLLRVASQSTVWSCPGRPPPAHFTSGGPGTPARASPPECGSDAAQLGQQLTRMRSLAACTKGGPSGSGQGTVGSSGRLTGPPLSVGAPKKPAPQRSERDKARRGGGTEVVEDVPREGVVEPPHGRGPAQPAVQPHGEGQRPLRVQPPAGPQDINTICRMAHILDLQTMKLQRTVCPRARMCGAAAGPSAPPAPQSPAPQPALPACPASGFPPSLMTAGVRRRR